MRNIGLPELLVVLVIVLLLFGAKKLPDLARSLGKSLAEFKKGKDEGMADITAKSKGETAAKPGEPGPDSHSP